MARSSGGDESTCGDAATTPDQCGERDRVTIGSEGEKAHPAKAPEGRGIEARVFEGLDPQAEKGPPGQ